MTLFGSLPTEATSIAGYSVSGLSITVVQEGKKGGGGARPWAVAGARLQSRGAHRQHLLAGAGLGLRRHVHPQLHQLPLRRRAPEAARPGQPGRLLLGSPSESATNSWTPAALVRPSS